MSCLLRIAVDPIGRHAQERAKEQHDHKDDQTDIPMQEHRALGIPDGIGERSYLSGSGHRIHQFIKVIAHFLDLLF